MTSLYLGLLAALFWAIHDLCIRFVTTRMSVELALLAVLASGLLFLTPAAAVWGDWTAMTSAALVYAVPAGMAYVAGLYAVYRAFAIGPVKLVAPIIGAYPILSMLWATVQGRVPSIGQMLAVLVIVAGVGLIATLSSEGEPPPKGATTGKAIVWAIGGALGFPVTFALGNIAVEHGSELPVTLIMRGIAVLSLFAAMLVAGARPSLKDVPWRILLVMGFLDVCAMGSVQAAARFPQPEFAVVAASTFGMLTILLAWAFLKERMAGGQWFAAALVFVSIGYLAI